MFLHLPGVFSAPIECVFYSPELSLAASDSRYLRIRKVVDSHNSLNIAQNAVFLRIREVVNGVLESRSRMWKVVDFH